MKIKKPKNIMKIDRKLEGFLYNLQVLSGSKSWNEVITDALNTYDFCLRYKKAGFQFKAYQTIPQLDEVNFEVPVTPSFKGGRGDQ